MKKAAHTFDKTVGQWVASLPDSIRIWMLGASFLGQPIFVLALGTLIIGFGFGSNDSAMTMAGFVAVGTLMISGILKMVLKRDRPATDYVEHMFPDAFSFPSGHAAGTLTTFGLVAYLALTLGEIWCLFLAIIITWVIILIGISRVYLGAHYASDVVGGWIIGTIGLSLITFVIQPSLY
jgi:undecaprenyl-diphosphatase